jgi:hypothetical protein
MPAANVRVPHEVFMGRSQRHQTVLAGLSNAPANIQRLVAELVVMRLFDEFMEAISGVALRLACGAPYVDGTGPLLLAPPAASTTSALDMFENLNRSSHNYAKWSKATFINETTKHVLDPADHFTRTCSNHGAVIQEMQRVRNRIGHSGSTARSNFSRVVFQHYVAHLNHVTPGMLLLSTRFKPSLLSRYISSARTIVKDCARA